VEDDPLMVRMYERVMRFSKLEMEVVMEGEKALSRLEEMEEKPALVLLDVMMPNIDGLEVLKRMKINPILKKIPVIVLTNLSAGVDGVTKALEAGADLCLIKSQHSPQDVVEKIKEVIAGGARGPRGDPAPQGKA